MGAVAGEMADALELVMPGFGPSSRVILYETGIPAGGFAWFSPPAKVELDTDALFRFGTGIHLTTGGAPGDLVNLEWARAVLAPGRYSLSANLLLASATSQPLISEDTVLELVAQFAGSESGSWWTEIRIRFIGSVSGRPRQALIDVWTDLGPVNVGSIDLSGAWTWMQAPVKLEFTFDLFKGITTSCRFGELAIPGEWPIFRPAFYGSGFGYTFVFIWLAAGKAPPDEIFLGPVVLERL